jgi:hypothetical protein
MMQSPLPFRFSVPINVFSNVLTGTLGEFGFPVVISWFSVGTFLTGFTPSAGEGSSGVPIIVTTADGTAFKDLRDPAGTWRNVSDGGTPVTSVRQTELTTQWNKGLNDLFNDQTPLYEPLDFRPSGVDPICNRDFTAARNWTAPRDPLVLDLDGDGIETVGINPLAPILFDHDADGIKTGTGWVASDDGLLVLDLNGNGTIDSGRELFGDNTALPGYVAGSPGSAGLASNGYQALAQHDSNLDGKINSQDAVYSQLRVWRDLNQDGISQAGELQTLQSLGIAGVGVVGKSKRYAFNSCLRNISLSYRPKSYKNSCIFLHNNLTKKRDSKQLSITCVYNPRLIASSDGLIKGTA